MHDFPEPSPMNVLVVEDNPSDADLMALRLKNEGFKLKWKRVETEQQYLAELQNGLETGGYDLILSDWVLPQFSGLRALQLMRQLGLDTPFIIVSGSIGEEAAVDAMRQGAYDYLLKDRLKRLGQAVRNAIEQKRLQEERQRVENLLRLQSAALNAAANAMVITYRDGAIEWVNPAFTTLTGYSAAEALGKNPRLLRSGLHDQSFYKGLWDTILAGRVWQGEIINRRKDGNLYPEEMTITPMCEPDGQISRFIVIKQDISDRKRVEEALKRSSQDLMLAYDATLQGWSNALELREHETAGHSRRVVELTLELAQTMGIGPADLVHIQRGALLHDIGKMGIPDNILLKPGPLNLEEWKVMRQHPIYAYNLLSRIPYLAPALDIPFAHHERWNGRGYPRGLKGEEIPLSARIFAVVDVWDALSNDRPYRSAWARAAVVSHLREQSGQHFDPNILEMFLRQV